MNRAGLVLRMYLRDNKAWLLIPWAVLLSSFIINLIIGFFIATDEPMITGGLVSIFIYFLIMGMVAVGQFFPFMLGFSIRRADFFLGSSAMMLFTAVFTALILLLLGHAEYSWTDRWGVDLHFFHLKFAHSGPWYEQLFIHLVGLMHMFYLGLAIGIFNRRFRATWTFILFVGISLILGLISMLCTRYHWWMDIWNWLVDQTAASLTLWSLPLVALYALAGYLLLRRAA